MMMNIFDAPPRIEILREPQPVYRMRYETDARKTNLFAEDVISLQILSGAVASVMTGESLMDDYESSESSNDALSSNQAGNERETKKRKRELVSVKIENVRHPSYLLVCCVNADEPHCVHPNMLVGENCQDGVYRIDILSSSCVIERLSRLKGVRIQLVKKPDLEARINQLRNLRVDPCLAGFEHKWDKLDLGKVRLCFQIIEKDFDFSPHPIAISKPISTSKQKLSILIQDMSEMSGPVSGGNRIALFVKKLEKDQKPIMARFFDNYGWLTDVLIERIHYQCALMVKVPAYKNQSILQDVPVGLKLFVAETEKKSGQMSVKYESESVPYTYRAFSSSMRGGYA